MNSGRYEFVIIAVVYMRPGPKHFVDYMRPVQTHKQEILGAIQLSLVDYLTYYSLHVLTGTQFTPIKTVIREP